MRHRKQYSKLGLKTNQRKALLKSLAISLIEHGAINTTKARAKELKRYVEKLISKVRKEDQTHGRRLVFKKLQSKEVVKKLFDEYKDAFTGRPGGYTRIHLLGNRAGDAAEMARISLILDGVDTKAEAVEDTTEEKKAPAKKKAAPKKKAAEKKDEDKKSTAKKKTVKKESKKEEEKTDAKQEDNAQVETKEDTVEETVDQAEEQKDEK